MESLANASRSVGPEDDSVVVAAGVAVAGAAIAVVTAAAGADVGIADAGGAICASACGDPVSVIGVAHVFGASDANEGDDGKGMVAAGSRSGTAADGSAGGRT